MDELQSTSEVEKSLKRKLDSDKESDGGEKKKICRKDGRGGFAESTFEEAEYYFENGLRKVYPYYFTYTTYCKGRWVGKSLIDVFSQEFRAHSREEYEKSIQNENIKINGKAIKSDYILKENDRITNRVHRHEIAVLAAPIKIIDSSDELIVIDKPPSVPVHPCGRYRHNSLLFILAKEHNLRDLHTVHRLDRLTSGVLLFTKTIKKSQEIDEQIRERKLKKEYVCRVEGLFPEGTVCCDEPIEVISPKMGICIVSSTGKECKTEFERLSYNGKSSVVKCRPYTGRMHQIRVHLQYLGYPILNDPIYNHANAFGPQKGKNGVTGKSRDQLLADLMNIHNLEKWLLVDNEKIVKEKIDDSKKEIYLDKQCDAYENTVAQNALKYYIQSAEYTNLMAQYVKKDEKLTHESTCDLCHQRYMDPAPKDLILFLHALKYKGVGFEFETEFPTWAKSDWKEM